MIARITGEKAGGKKREDRDKPREKHRLLLCLCHGRDKHPDPEGGQDIQKRQTI